MVVDNTFASPYVQRPIDFGADLVVHSTTKFLNGHSDSVGGVVVAVRDDHVEWLRFVQNAEGAILGPMDAWLVLRGTKTLPIRMERHNANALALAEFLAAHPKVHARALPRAAVASAARAGAAADARVRRASSRSSSDRSSRRARCSNTCRLMALAESLGGVETLISHPATMTHASVPPERRQPIGLTDDMVRSRSASRTSTTSGRPRAGARPLDVRSRPVAELLDLLLHVDVTCSISSTTYGIWIYAILFLIVFAETGLVVTPFLPGDSLLFAAGRAGRHRRARHRRRRGSCSSSRPSPATR